MPVHHFIKDWQNTKSYLLDIVFDLCTVPKAYLKPAIQDVAWFVDYEQVFS